MFVYRLVYYEMYKSVMCVIEYVFKILVVQNTDLLICILLKINFRPAQKHKVTCNLFLWQVVQNTGGPKIQNADGARATSVF